MITDTRDKIIEFITKNKQARVHDLVLNLKIGNVAIHRQLNKLISAGVLRKIGKPPIVFYTLNNQISSEVGMEGIKQKAVPILKKEGVIRAAVFGSVARGEDRENSDIDILIDLPRGKTLFDLGGIKIKLEESLGREVDVITYNSIDPLIKDYILKDQFKII